MQIELPTDGGYLLIDADPPPLPRDGRTFDPRKDRFNLLDDFHTPDPDYNDKKARQFAEVAYTAYPQGATTLTTKYGKPALKDMLLEHTRLDKITVTDKTKLGVMDAKMMVDDMLASPVLKRIFCGLTPDGKVIGQPNFFYKPNSVIHARINRAELGPFPARILAWVLMSNYPGPIIVPDGDFYLRDAHDFLVLEDRLITGVRQLKNLPPLLHDEILVLSDIVTARTTFRDAEELAEQFGYRDDYTRKDNEYTRFIADCMSDEVQYLGRP